MSFERRAVLMVMGSLLASCVLTTSFDYETNPSSDSSLSALTVAGGTISPDFTPATHEYSVDLRARLFPLPPPALAAAITATPAQRHATVRVAGVSAGPLTPLVEGTNTVPIVVTAPDRVAQTQYLLQVNARSSDYIKPSEAHGSSAFGVAVSLSKDTLAVGAPGADGGGAVYVFVRSNDTWVQQAALRASNAGSLDKYSPPEFGIAVALSGDTLAVGAPDETSCASGVGGGQSGNCRQAGAVYVFERSGGTWSQRAYIKPSNTATQRAHAIEFGSSLALSGDTLVVGAPSESSCASSVDGDQQSTACFGAGAAYVFTRAGGSWKQQAYLKASNTAAQFVLGFGTSVALANDTLAIGAPAESSCATGIGGAQNDLKCSDSGAAYVFTRAAGVWSQQAYVKASNTSKDGAFGKALALAGDRLVVGAPREKSCATGVGGSQTDAACPGAGAAYVFDRSGASWTQSAYVKPSNTLDQSTLAFGFSVALSADAFAVGAIDESSCARGLNGDQASTDCSLAGAAYLFNRSFAQQAYVKAPNSRIDGVFGASVALSADTLAVGAPAESSGATGVNGDQTDTSVPGAGAAYVF